MISLRLFFNSLIIGGAIGCCIVLLLTIPDSLYSMIGYTEVPIIGEINNLDVSIVLGSALGVAMLYVYLEAKVGIS